MEFFSNPLHLMLLIVIVVLLFGANKLGDHDQQHEMQGIREELHGSALLRCKTGKRPANCLNAPAPRRI